MDTVISNDIESIRTPPPRRSRRTRQSSSISGMFEDPMKAPPTPPPPASPTSDNDDCDIQELARRLRRTKRSLLLKSAESPKSPVDKFRSIVLTLSAAGATTGNVSPSPLVIPSHQQPSKE